MGKETIVGLLVALQRYAANTDESRSLVWSARIGRLAAALSPLRNASVAVREGLVPKLAIMLTEGKAMDACVQLQDGDPSVHVDPSEVGSGTLVVNPFCLKDDEVELLARRIREVIG